MSRGKKIFFTADEEKILRAGCEAYISKPISIDHFLATVRKFLNETVEA